MLKHEVVVVGLKNEESLTNTSSPVTATNCDSSEVSNPCRIAISFSLPIIKSYFIVCKVKHQLTCMETAHMDELLIYGQWYTFQLLGVVHF